MHPYLNISLFLSTESHTQLALLLHWMQAHISFLFKISLVMQDPNKAYDHFAAYYTRLMSLHMSLGEYDSNTRFFISVPRFCIGKQCSTLAGRITNYIAQERKYNSVYACKIRDLGTRKTELQFMDCNHIKHFYVVNMQIQQLLFCSYFRKNWTVDFHFCVVAPFGFRVESALQTGVDTPYC